MEVWVLQARQRTMSWFFLGTNSQDPIFGRQKGSLDLVLKI
jgi:hypothetical protein